MTREQRAIGIILRLYPLTETSLIVHWLTPELGRLATVAKGARRPKSPFRGKLDLFFKLDMSFLRSRSSELHTLREINLLNSHPALRQDLEYLNQAAYCAALIEQTTETDTPLPKLYELLDTLLDYLPQQGPEPQTVFAFELKLLEDLGLSPTLPRDAVSPGSTQILEKLLRSDWAAIGRLRLSELQVREIRQFLHGFLIFHLGKFPESRAKAIAPAKGPHPL